MTHFSFHFGKNAKLRFIVKNLLKLQREFMF